ncbi:hypothetical protein M493_14920 [Geobacillus genomosp. 3]|uniref:Uncharacterized protein n=1 Tax=Geobacillus genomosp. 3 TaxID=1921421 RepID=S6A3M5_GEOG3|nr:hypothetical protein M493_14920 [Geobacillus genomosp. 3]
MNKTGRPVGTPRFALAEPAGILPERPVSRWRNRPAFCPNAPFCVGEIGRHSARTPRFALTEQPAFCPSGPFRVGGTGRHSARTLRFALAEQPAFYPNA